MNNPFPEPGTPARRRAPAGPGRLLRLFLPLAVLALGGTTAAWLLNTGPEAKPRRPPANAALVEVQPVVFGPGQSVVEAMGTLRPAREVELKAQVGGEVIEISPNLVPGGLFRKGDLLLRVDPADYELAVRQLEGEVAQAEAELRLEQGNQDVARREVELLGEEVGEEDLELVLRQPQLASVQARLATAGAKLARARLDLERTVIRAPFNAVVQARAVNIGARVTENSSLATLVGTDRYWVEAAVPVRQLAWLRIPATEAEGGSRARIYDTAAWGQGSFREGRVIRLAADLEEQGRLAKVLIAVEDPLGLAPGRAGRPKLLLGSYVRAEIEGRQLDQVAALDRRLLRDGDRVWLLGGGNKLEIRPVEIVFRGRDQVLVAGGLAPGDRLVVTDLAAPVAGMPLRTPGMETAAEGAPSPAAAAETIGRQGRS